MKPIHSSKAANHIATQTLNILRNPKVHSRVSKSLPLEAYIIYNNKNLVSPVAQP
jgi:hypothetical protein